jgi:hypothetical protein
MVDATTYLEEATARNGHVRIDLSVPASGLRTWPRRLWHWLRGCLQTSYRAMTDQEAALLYRVHGLERLKAGLEADVRAWKLQVEELKADLQVRERELRGMALVVEHYDKRRERELAVEARRIADTLGPQSGDR